LNAFWIEFIAIEDCSASTRRLIQVCFLILFLLFIVILGFG